jgi:hypothetical protein
LGTESSWKLDVRVVGAILCAILRCETRYENLRLDRGAEGEQGVEGGCGNRAGQFVLG